MHVLHDFITLHVLHDLHEMHGLHDMHDTPKACIMHIMHTLKTMQTMHIMHLAGYAHDLNPPALRAYKTKTLKDHSLRVSFFEKPASTYFHRPCPANYLRHK